VPQYDSLSATTPWAVLIIDAVSLDKPVTVKFFNRLPGDPLLLGIIDNVQPALFSYDRIKRIFITRSDFMTK
ncbi:MAG TPA: hypothetical protein VI583_01080, partial [Cyclobacteriaceae bacterium]|nr:hypothetical protein [Cyclobacteriaceae bacterium]